MYLINIKVLDDSIDANGNIMSYLQLKIRYSGIQTNLLAYQRLKCAIPALWIDLLWSGNDRHLTEAVREEPLEIKLGEDWMTENIKSKQFYLDNFQNKRLQHNYNGKGSDSI